MGKGWAWFFGVTLMATFLIWFIAPFYGWWLPENINKEYGTGIDNLFFVILGFTAFFFVLTEVILVYAMAKFGHRAGEKSTYTHGNHRLEMLWTAVPAAILLFIAFAQVRVWEKIKYRSRFPSPDITLAVTARQWEWRMRYAAQPEQFRFTPGDDRDKALKERRGRAWAEAPQIDDLHDVNAIHCWNGANVKIWLQSRDVIHSLTLPNLRIKQDALPGKLIPMWFQPTKANTRFIVTDPKTGEGYLEEPGDKMMAWELTCQEHCGARHYAMRGRLYVHESEESYHAWMRWARARQQARSPEKGLARGE